MRSTCPVKFLLLGLLLGSASVPRAFSQTVELPAVIIEETLPFDLLAPSAGTTIIEEHAIQTSAAPDLPSLLSSVPGVILSPTGSEGAQASVSLRGSTSNQVLVLVDGVRVTDPATGLTDFSRLGIPLDQIVQIEVQRGGLSAQYGADAVGGVIHIHTRRGSKNLSARISLENTSFLPSSITIGNGLSAITVPFVGSALIDGQSLSLAAENQWLSAWAKISRAANGYPYYDTNGERRRRENAGLLAASGGMQTRFPLSAGEISSSAKVSYRSVGIPGSLDIPTPEAHQEDWNANLTMQFRTDALLAGALALELSPYAQAGGIRYQQSQTSAVDSHISYRAGLDSSLSWLPPWNGEVKAGASFRYDRLESSVVKGAGGSAPERFSGGIFAEPSFGFGTWTAVPALRFDMTNDFPSGVSASFGLIHDFSKQTAIRATISSAYRAPSFDDLYWPASGGAEGNPSLKPESAISSDISLTHKEDACTWSVGTFARYARDVILWQPDDAGIWKPSNFGNALYPGIEAESSWKAGSWNLGANYTFLYSYVLSGNLSLSDDRRVPYVPVHAASLSASRTTKAFKSAFLFTYQSLRFTTTGNRAFLPATLIANAKLTWELGPRSDFELSFQNLFDERYEAVKGYPMPGFSLSATVTLRFEGARPGQN